MIGQGELIQDFENEEIVSARISDYFDKGLSVLKKERYKLISMRDNIELSLARGYYAGSDVTCHRMAEAFIYIPNKGVFLSRNSPLVSRPNEAVKAHSPGSRGEFYLNEGQLEYGLRSSVQIPHDLKSISTDRFGEDSITEFCFGKKAKDYGKFLMENEFSILPVAATLGCEPRPYDFAFVLENRLFVNSQSKPFAYQAVFTPRGLGGISRIGYPTTIRGIKRQTKEAISASSQE